MTILMMKFNANLFSAIDAAYPFNALAIGGHAEDRTVLSRHCDSVCLDYLPDLP
jgi:hypothetical protein